MLDKIKNYFKKTIAGATIGATLLTAYPALAKDREYVIPKGKEAYSKLIDAIKSKVKDNKVKESIDKFVDLIYIKEKEEGTFNAWALQDDGDKTPEAGIDTVYSDENATNVDSYTFSTGELKQAGLELDVVSKTEATGLVAKATEAGTVKPQESREYHWVVSRESPIGKYGETGRTKNIDNGSIKSDAGTTEERFSKTETGRQKLREARERKGYIDLFASLGIDDKNRYAEIGRGTPEWETARKIVIEQNPYIEGIDTKELFDGNLTTSGEIRRIYIREVDINEAGGWNK